MKHGATDANYLIAGYVLFPAVFLAAFMWLEWRGLGIASLATVVAGVLCYKRVKDEPSAAARAVWKRFLLVAGVLLAVYGLIAFLAVLANRWEALGLLVIASVLFFSAIFFTLTISFASGVRALATEQRLLFWLVPQGVLLAACVITLLIAN